MTMHPYIGSENLRERQREMMAQAARLAGPPGPAPAL